MRKRVNGDPAPALDGAASPMELTDGSRVGVIGGGPAGSMFSYFLLGLAERAGMTLQVDLYEPKDFAAQGPGGCNMCGGIISETLVQNLAAEGINLPPTVVQRGIDSYMLHMDVGSVRIETPLQEKRIASVYRGLGPRSAEGARWDSFDGFLLSLAVEKGASLIRERVQNPHVVDGHPQIDRADGSSCTYDLLVVAAGINGGAAQLFKRLGLDDRFPKTTKTFIREYFLGEELMSQTLGSSMQVFLLDIPNLKFAALVPKGDYATMCLLGEGVDKQILESFLDSREFQNCLPDDKPAEQACKCAPRMNIGGALQPYEDRVVFIGDSGVTRLYKDGIGAAYRTAKAAASAAVFEGVSAEAFRRHYKPICRRVEADNRLGRWVFAATTLVQKRRFARLAVLHMVAKEQDRREGDRRMSATLWDMFTGSASYQEILLRTLHPRFWVRFGWELACALLPRRRRTATRSQSAA